jgi:hypothetical protein
MTIKSSPDAAARLGWTEKVAQHNLAVVNFVKSSLQEGFLSQAIERSSHDFAERNSFVVEFSSSVSATPTIHPLFHSDITVLFTL